MKTLSIAKHLEALSVGTIGVTLFVNSMPASCVEGILVLDAYHGTPIDHNLPNYRATGLTTSIRSKDFERGINLAWSVLTALTIHAETSLYKMLLKSMLPMNEPRPYKRSAGGYWEFEIDFEMHYVREP